jgi:N6-adenosine-specific RNA methylase IME4
MTVFAELTPPWHYDARPVGGSKPGTMGAAKAFPYSTMTIDEIRDMPVAELAANDSVLWLWTTNKWLRESFTVMDAWGFGYRQTLVWGKNNPMPVGSVAPSAAEFLLVGKRGKPHMEWVWPSSVIVTPRPRSRQHSVKPDCFRDYIEASSPGPYVELFARAPRLGWDSWGYGYEIGESA